jgi:hypothetical protein
LRRSLCRDIKFALSTSQHLDEDPAAFSGPLILIAAVSIGVAAVDRLITPKPVEKIGVGLVVS